MRADSEFQHWLASATQEEGVTSLTQARLLLQHMERRQRDVNFYGVVLSSFVVCAIKTLQQGILHFLNMRNTEYKIDFDVFSYAIPFVGFVLDHSIKRVKPGQVKEKSIFVLLKLFYITFYLGVYVMSLEQQGAAQASDLSTFYVLVSANLILFPLLSSSYSLLLYRGRLA